MKITFVPTGSTPKRSFLLQDYFLRDVLMYAKKIKENFEIEIEVDGTLLIEPVVGTTNSEKRRNLKIFLGNYREDYNLLVRNEREFILSLISI